MNRVMSKLICVIFFLSTALAAAAFAEEIPRAKEFYSKETGQLYWKPDNDTKIELLCDFDSEELISLSPKCEAELHVDLPDYGKSFVSITVRTRTHEIDTIYPETLNWVRSFRLDEALQSKQPIYLLTQTTYGAYGEDLNINARNSVVLDTSNAESAIALQIKTYRAQKLIEILPLGIFTILGALTLLAATLYLFKRHRQKFKEIGSRVAATPAFLSKLINSLKCSIKILAFKQRKLASPSSASELLALAKLKDDGHITDEEFQALKRKLISS